MSTAGRVIVVLVGIALGAMAFRFIRGSAVPAPGKGQSPDAAILAAADGSDPFVCDMHCEPGKTYARQGICPVCRMALTPLSKAPHGLAVYAEPSVINAGQPVRLRLRPLGRTGLPIEQFDIVHEYPLHLIGVSEDLSWYSHEHPERLPSGEFEIELVFPRAGTYTLFADFSPTGDGPRWASSPLAVAGATPSADASGDRAREPLREDFDEIKTIAGYEFRIRCNGGRFIAGADSYIRYGITRNGRTVTELQPYLGERGHLVIISGDRTRYIHNHAVHTADPPPNTDAPTPRSDRLANGDPADVVFHTVLPAPGLYRIFAQFKIDDQIVTVPFTIDAAPGEGASPAADAPPAHDHSRH